MKITVLTENTACSPEYGSEHGLSIFIEFGKYNILFDTGQTDLFAENAEKLGIDLKTVDYLVISHGHYDHGGGLKKFMEINDKAEILISKYAFEPHFNAENKDIGLDVSLKYNQRFVFVESEYSIDENIRIYSSVNRKCDCYNDNFGLTVLENDVINPDDFRHEIYLSLSENNVNYVFSGCAHKGVLNIMNWFEPDVFIGGFHFMKIDPSEEKELLLELADDLMGYSAEYYTCHCTGEAQYSVVKEKMGEKLHYISSGMSVDFCISL